MVGLAWCSSQGDRHKCFIESHETHTELYWKDGKRYVTKRSQCIVACLLVGRG